MINVNMTEKAGVTLATAGKYCADNVKVTPSAEILRKDEQTKSATPTETAQDITPDSGKVLSKVSVGAIPKTYVGSGVTKKAAATVSPSTIEQTVCESGVYTTGAQKVSAITPSIVGNLDASSFASSIVAAIEGKGVTVPDGTLLDGVAAMIDSIEAGGGGGIVYTSGTLVFSSSTKCSGYELTHGLGQIPQIFIITSKFQGNSNYSLCYYAEINESLRNLGFGADRFCYAFANYGVNYSRRYGLAANSVNTMDENKITFREANYSHFDNSQVYSWIAIGGIAV